MRPVTAAIGAEVRGLTAGPGLDRLAIVELRRALLTHKVVFLRDQHGVDDDAQRAFAAQLGTLTTAHPTVAGVVVGSCRSTRSTARPAVGTPTSPSWIVFQRSASSGP